MAKRAKSCVQWWFIGGQWYAAPQDARLTRAAITRLQCEYIKPAADLLKR